MNDLKEAAYQLVHAANAEVLARYTTTEIEHHISNLQEIISLFDTENYGNTLEQSLRITLEQMIENLEYTTLEHSP